MFIFQMKIFNIFLFFVQNIVGTCKNRLSEAVLTSTHNLCFGAKIRKIYTPVNPSFTIQKWGVRGSSLHASGKRSFIEIGHEKYFLHRLT